MSKVKTRSTIVNTSVVCFLFRKEPLVPILTLLLFFYETFSLILKLVLWIPKTYGFSHFLKKLRARLVKDNTRRNLVHFVPMFVTNVQIKSFYDCTCDNFTCHHSCMLAITYVTTLWWTHILIVHAISICDYHQYKWKIWCKVNIYHLLSVASINGWQPSCFWNCISNHI